MKKYPILITLVIILIIPQFVIAQINSGGIPLSFNQKNISQQIADVKVDSPDLQKINAEDLISDTSFLPRRISTILPVDIDMIQSGSWLKLDNGSHICRLKIHTKGALASNLYFNKLFLPEGAKLFLYDESRKQIKGAFTNQNNSESGYFATELIVGENIILELNLPDEIESDPIINISGFGYAYRDVPRYTESKGFGGSDWCEINIKCSPEGDDWQTQKSAVVRILVKVSGAGFWCTGSLVNNVEFDGTPYLLTADHCAFQLNQYASESDLDQWIFYFNYESNTCENPVAEPELLSMVGASKVAQGGKRGQEGSDFYLLLLNDQVPTSYGPHYLGWSRLNEGSDQGVTIHHPEGDIKKISTFLIPLESSGWYGNGLQSHWKVYWGETENNWAVTESGSSGSPLFNEQGKLIGTLTGGLAACDASGSLGPDKPDYYGKFSYHWESNGTADTAQLKPWLDPNNTGVYSCDGLTLDVEDYEIVNNLEINIYPNPANEYFFINFTSVESSQFSVAVYNILGKPVKELNSQYLVSNFKVDVNNIPEGVYFLAIDWGNNNIVKKLIIQ